MFDYFFKPPLFDDQAKTHTARLLFIILWTLMFFMLVTLFLPIALPETIWRVLLLILIAETWGSALLILNRRGHVRLASNLLIITVWGLSTAIALTTGGIHSHSVALYLIIVFIAGLLLGGKAGAIAAVGCSLTELGLVFIEKVGALPSQMVFHTAVTLWMNNTVYMSFIVGLQYLASQTILKSLQQAHQELDERRRVEKAFQESEAKYKLLVDFLPIAIIEIDNQGNVTSFNRSSLEFFGYSQEDLERGINAAQVFSPEELERVGVQMQKVMEGTSTPGQEFIFLKKDGSTFPGLIYSSRIIQENEIVGIRAAIINITIRKQMEEEIKALSITDSLTGLYNRRGFLTLADLQMKMAKRTGNGLLLLFADLDGMKAINDNLGHSKGDEALIETADVFKKVFREADIIARVGGDEFAVLALETSCECSDMFRERLQRHIDLSNSRKNRDYHLSISIGMVCCNPEDPSSIYDLMSRADGLMYENKKSKKL